MRRNLDLTKINDHAMATVLEPKMREISYSKTKEEVYNLVDITFKENNINTEASRRLLLHIKQSKNYFTAIETTLNSIFVGSGMGMN